MRVYVPAVLSELSVLLPPVRVGVVAVPDAAMSGEDVEVLEDDAITEAALSSLELARETDGALPARVVPADARTYVSARSGQALAGDIDLVFIDPPYDIAEDDMTTVLSSLGPWIGPDALVVVERSTRAPAPTWPDFLVLEDQRTWGETVAYFAGPPLPKDETGDVSQVREDAPASSHVEEEER